MKLHANAALSLTQRRRMVLRVLEQGWTIKDAAAAAETSRETCGKWVSRYRASSRERPVGSQLGAALVANRTDEQRIAGDRGAAAAALYRAGDRGAARDGALDGVGDPDPDRDGPPGPVRAGAGRALRARAAGRADPHRHQEARAHPGRRRQTRPRRAAPALQPAPHRRARACAARRSAGTTCTSPSTTPPGWPTPKSCADEKASTAIAFLGRARGLLRPPRHHRRAGDDRQRLAPTAPRSTRSPAARWASATSAPAPTGPRPTARPNASSARCSPAGPTARSTAPAENAPPPLTAGYSPTTITADTDPSAASHPSHD